MSCKSALYAANTAGQSLAAGGTINFGTAVRRYGNNINIAGGNVSISGAGYYDLDVNVTLAAGAAGDVVVTLYNNGAAVQGATASATLDAANDVVAITIPAIIREMCCVGSTITAVVTGIATTVTNAAIAVEKI